MRSSRSSRFSSNHLAETAGHASGNGAHEDGPAVGAHGPGPAVGGTQNLTISAGEEADVVGESVVGGGLGGKNTGVRAGGAKDRGNLGHSLVTLVTASSVGLFVVGGRRVLGVLRGLGVLAILGILAVRRARVGGVGGTRVEEGSATRAVVALAGSRAHNVLTGLGEVDGFTLDGHTLALLVNIGDEHCGETVKAGGLALGLHPRHVTLLLVRVGVGMGSVLHRRVRDVSLVGVLLLLHVVHLLALGLGMSRVSRGHSRKLFALGVAADGDERAVHVHLAVANLVEPGPSQESLAIGSIGGNRELVLLGDRTIAQHGLNDLECFAPVVGQRNLARTAIVSGTALKGHLVLLTGLVGGLRVEVVVGIALARVVTTRAR